MDASEIFGSVGQAVRLVGVTGDIPECHRGRLFIGRTGEVIHDEPVVELDGSIRHRILVAFYTRDGGNLHRDQFWLAPEDLAPVDGVLLAKDLLMI